MSDEDPKAPDAPEKAAGPPAEEAAPTPEELAAAEAAKAAAAAEAKAKAAAAAKAKAEAKAAAEAAKPPWERDAVTPEWADASDDLLARAIRAAFGEEVLETRTAAGTLTFELAPGSVARVGESLKRDHGFTYLIDICGADYPDREQRFDVVYHLHRFSDHRRIRLRARVGEGEEVTSVCGVWRAANWCEREAYDMYGILFSGHPDLTRILLWEGFNGYPLRKDFPVEGIDTGSAIYPEYYDDEAGPIAGTGTGWKVPEPPDPEPDPEPPPAAEPEAPPSAEAAGEVS